MIQTAISFECEDLTLYGMLAMPMGHKKPVPAVVVCHPHPALGGHMDNGVVLSVCHALAEEGIAAFRFNCPKGSTWLVISYRRCGGEGRCKGSHGYTTGHTWYMA